MQTSVDVTMYSAQVPWPSSGAKQATLLPISPRPINPPPEAMTVPLPSNPGTTGNDLVIPYWPFRNIRSAGPIDVAANLISGAAPVDYEISSWRDLEKWFRAHVELQKHYEMTRGCPFGTLGKKRL